MNFFNTDKHSAFEAKSELQKLAFSPYAFQAAILLRKGGLLKEILQAGDEGIGEKDLCLKSSFSEYGTRVLVEAGLGIGLIREEADLYILTKMGFIFLHDEMTGVNFDFMQDVCFKGSFNLEESLQNGSPEGLKQFGEWSTVYQGLAHLPTGVQKSWFAFDHFYSDTAFPEALEIVFSDPPAKLLDIGGNTGKWAMAACSHSDTLEVGIFDLEGQTSLAARVIEKSRFAARIKFHQGNILDKEMQLPQGYGAIWMSQFLDCFSEEEIAFILLKCRAALKSGGSIFVLEPFWDLQQYEASAYSLIMTSLYFTTMANGNSKMYRSNHFRLLIEKAGLEIVEQKDGLGIGHSLLKCRAS